MESLLSIKIITYNRGEKLCNTLNRLLASPLSKWPVEVFDNASTDDTPQVLANAVVKFPRLTVTRHRRNIGACANLLRAYESFESTYCWLLCDDDELDFTAAAELIECLENSQHDVVAVGEVAPIPSFEGYSGTTLELQSKGARLYQTFSFLPAMIFRQSFLDNGILFRCNRAASSLWPHVCLLEAVIERNSRLKILSKPIVYHRSPVDFKSVTPLGLSDIAQAGWYLNVKHRARFMDDMLERRSRSIKELIRPWVSEKISGKAVLWRFAHFFSIYRYRDIRITLSAWLVLMSPRKFWEAIRGEPQKNSQVVPHELNPRL